MNQEGFLTTCYDTDGNTRIRVRLLPGDEVVWKRNGTRGAYRARVAGYGRTLHLDLLSHDGVELSKPRRVNVTRGILKAFRGGAPVSRALD